jgi:hypothetical protein
MYKIIGADQKQYGPVTEAEMRQWIAEGRVNAQTLIQAEGQTDWRPLSTFPEFANTASPLPASAPLSANPYSTVDAKQLVNGPGIGLLVIGLLCALASLIGAAGNIVRLASGSADALPAGIPPEFRQIFQNSQKISAPIGLVFNFVGLVLGGVCIFASTKLRKLESYGLVMTATILSMVPCFSSCCCVINLGIGIWIIVVLNKPEVKSAFH